MAQQQQQSQSDNSFAPIWIMCALFLVIYVIWHNAHQYIVNVVFAINLFEAKIIGLFTDDLANTVYIMQTVDPKSVKWDDLVALTTQVGSYLCYPIFICMVIFGIILYFSNIKLKFKKTYSMQTLRQQERQNWPQIMPVADLDLVEQDIATGPWAMALSPVEFCRKNDLMKRDDFAPELSGYPGVTITAAIKKGEAKRIFTLQLGSYWQGFDKLNGATMALCAVFMARINHDRDGALKLMNAINVSAGSGNPDFTGARELLNKHKNTEIVQEIVEQHAYVLTVMISLLIAARHDGVLASADFLWLKPLDRRLWYTLNSLGRQTPFAEVAGVYAHWKAEKAMKRKSMVPMIEEAIKAIELAVKEVKLPLKELRKLTS